MSVSFRSSLRELHSSVGLVIGWIGFFLFLFGSLALYRSEITFWLQPETHNSPAIPATPDPYVLHGRYTAAHEDADPPVPE